MCARTTLRKKRLKHVAEELEAEFSPEDEILFKSRYNVAPSDTTWILEAQHDHRVLRPAVWGYVVRDRPLVNVRGEQVASGSGFREAFHSRRCAVVTDGFFEWDRQKRPTWFHREDDGLVLLGGLVQMPADGRPRFAVLTTRPNDLIARIHDRMPVIVRRQEIDEWLTADPTKAANLIRPAANDFLVATAVSKRVNSVKNDDPDCLAPPMEDIQTSLF